MASNVQKTPLSSTLNRFAEKKVFEAIQLQGRALPASVTAVAGSIVTVRFEISSAFTLPNVTVPLAGAQYIRFPTQVGDTGFVVSADAYLGGVSGLGGGTADLTLPANLSALVFFPIGNKTWAASEDPNAIVLYGPDGGILRSTDKTATLKVLKTECSITPPAGQPFTVNGNLIVTGNVQISGSIQNLTGGVYDGDLHTSGAVIAGFGTGNQVGVQTHTHTQPNDSHGDAEQATAAPTAGT